MTMNDSGATTWRDRVEQYVDELANLTETIDLILDETRVRTIGLKAGEVDESTRQLADAIDQLETMVQRREALMKSEDAPTPGLSLSEKLLRTRKIEDARLARRCGEVAEAMQTTHSRATALFVCQYHLSAVQRELLDRLSGVTAPPTYDRKGQSAKAKPGSHGRGGLFNDAA